MSYMKVSLFLWFETDMKEIIEKAFDWLLKMLVEKKYSRNLRALRMLMQEVLRLLLKDGTITSHS